MAWRKKFGTLVGTLVTCLSAQKSELNDTFQSRLPILPLHTSVKVFPALVRTPIPDNFTNQSSVNIFLTTPNVPYITIRANSLPSLALHFISLPWKRLSSNLWILFSASKKNSFTPWRSLKLFIGWLFQRFDEVRITFRRSFNQWQLAFLLSPKPFLIGHCFNQWVLFFSVYNPVRLYLYFILTMSLEECQTKSFGMNLLLHAIFKFCTTKRLFKFFVSQWHSRLT